MSTPLYKREMGVRHRPCVRRDWQDLRFAFSGSCWRSVRGWWSPPAALVRPAARNGNQAGFASS